MLNVFDHFHSCSFFASEMPFTILVPWEIKVGLDRKTMGNGHHMSSIFITSFGKNRDL
jgi:hypothetical protein